MVNHIQTGKQIRHIARLDVKGGDLIKGVHLEGLRKVGKPEKAALRYYKQGADEIIYIDLVASLYGRSNLTQIVAETTDQIFIPVTVGGGIRSCNNVEELLRSGADKIAINTAIVKRPELIGEIANRFGSQCMVASIEAKKNHQDSSWSVLTDCGREKSGKDVVSWAKQCEELGAGEILLTSVDREGTKKGFDVDLLEAVSQNVNIPVTISGGFGQAEHIIEISKLYFDSIAFADALHFNKYQISELKEITYQTGFNVRELKWSQKSAL